VLNALGNILALIISFAILGIFLYLKIHIGIVLVATSIIMTFISLGPLSVPDIILRTACDGNTIRLVIITSLIMILISIYKETGYIDRLSKSLRKILKKSSLSLMIIPAVLGLLPVAGGALMSAPLVDIEGDRLKLSASEKVFINIWFRHLVFLIYPLSQVLILIATLSGVSIWSIIIRQMPVMIFMLVLGFAISFIRRSELRHDTSHESYLGNKHAYYQLYIELLKTILPIIIPVLISILVELDLSISILVGIIILIILSRPRYIVFKHILKDSKLYLIILAAFGAMLLRNTIIHTGIQNFIASSIIRIHIPFTLLMILLPMILAILTGMTYSSLAISIPILQTISDFTVKEASLAYISAFIGYLGAPTHLCLILSLNYFRSSLFMAYKYLLPANVATLVFAVLLYLVW